MFRKSEHLTFAQWIVFRAFESAAFILKKKKGSFSVSLQSRTVWTQEVVTYVDFSGLAPGQNYCAVANFSFPTFSMAASSKSAPQCVETVSKPGERKSDFWSSRLINHAMTFSTDLKCLYINYVFPSGLLPVLCLGIGLTSLLLAPLLALFLRRPRRATPATEDQPKAPVYSALYLSAWFLVFSLPVSVWQTAVLCFFH